MLWLNGFKIHNQRFLSVKGNVVYNYKCIYVACRAGDPGLNAFPNVL